MRLPKFSELIGEQRGVVRAPEDDHLFVVGPPGSGKTSVAIHRAQILAGMGQSVLILTYNRLLRRQIELRSSGNLHASTMHSHVFGHWKRTFGEDPPQFGPHRFRWQAMVQRAHSAGLRPDWDHVLVDEAQDLPPGFFAYARWYLGRFLTVLADEDQSLAEERASLRQIQEWGRLPEPITLAHNHRNTPEIARLAEHFHGGIVPLPTVCRSGHGELPWLVHSPAVVERVAVHFRNRGGTVGLVLPTLERVEGLAAELAVRLPEARVDYYSSRLRNEAGVELDQPGVTILTPHSVKGLEFDALFVADIQALHPWRDPQRKRLLYVLCSRARDTVGLIVTQPELPSALLQDLPRPDVLAR